MNRSFVIAHDNKLFAQGIEHLITKRWGTSGWHIYSVVDNGDDAWDECRKIAPDFLVIGMEIGMFDVIQKIKNTSLHTKVIILAPFNRDEVSDVEKKWGASAIVFKDDDFYKFFDAVCRAEKE